MIDKCLQLDVSSTNKYKLKQIIKIIKQKYQTSYDYESFLICVIDSFKAYEVLQNFKSYKKCKQVQPCSICNKQICLNQHIRHNSCNHIFHKRCIDNLIIHSNIVSCPICFKQFIPQN